MQDESLSFEFKQQILSRLESQSESYNNQKEKVIYLKILNVLVEKDKQINVAIVNALKGISNENLQIRKNSFELINLLLEKEYGMLEIVQAALQGLFDSRLSVRFNSLKLLKVIVEKEHKIPEAARIALKNLLDSDVFETLLRTKTSTLLTGSLAFLMFYLLYTKKIF